MQQWATSFYKRCNTVPLPHDIEQKLIMVEKRAELQELLPCHFFRSS